MTEPIKWRDARKVKPENGDCVLIKPVNGNVTLAWWDGRHSWVAGSGAHRTAEHNITHWAPMPKGPKR